MSFIRCLEVSGGHQYSSDLVMSGLWVDVSVCLLVTRWQFYHTQMQKAAGQSQAFLLLHIGKRKYLPQKSPNRFPLTSHWPELHHIAVIVIREVGRSVFSQHFKNGVGMIFG